MSDIDPIGDNLPEGVTLSGDQIKAHVDREVAARIHVRDQEHATALTAATEQGARGAVLSTLDGMIAGNAGDDLAASQFREKIRDLKFELMSGDKRPAAELGAEAVRLNEARIQGLAATSGGAEGEQLAEVHADNRGGYQTFAGAYMGALFNESKRLGESLDGEKLTGSPEMEYASSLLDKPGMRDEYQRLSAEAGPRARVVPMPLSMLRPDAMFAETRAAAVVAGDLRREPTYRRDALVYVLPAEQRARRTRRAESDYRQRHHAAAPERFDCRELADGSPKRGRRLAGRCVDHDQPEAPGHARQPFVHAARRCRRAVRA